METGELNLAWLGLAWPRISLNSLVVKRSCDSNHHRTSSDGCWASFSNTILPNFLVAINLFSVEDCDCQNQQIGFYVIVARYLTTGWEFCEDRPKIGSFPTLRMLAMLLNQKTGWNLFFFLQTVSYYQKFYHCFTAALRFYLEALFGPKTISIRRGFKPRSSGPKAEVCQCYKCLCYLSDLSMGWN